MLADLSGPPANPSSAHWFGQQARHLLTQARTTTAAAFSAKPEEIIFTSGGTEGLNFLLRGLTPKGHLITTAIEHSSIYRTVQSLEAKGLSVTYLPVTLWGAPLPAQLEEAIRPDTTAIILSAANTETGVKIDLPAIAQIAERRHIPLLIDAVALIGKEPFTLPRGVSALVLAAHKFHGPKGVGAVFLRSGLKIAPLLTGGNQENLQRAGTGNLAGILGMAEALTILKEHQPAITQTLADLRNHFELSLLRTLPDLVVNGQGPRIPSVSNLAFLGVDGETLLMQLDLAGIAASHGSACSSGASEPSRVLTQMGVDRKTARSSIRFSVGRTNTREEIDQAVERITHIVTKLRSLK
jgi:cysteine desulfurase